MWESSCAAAVEVSVIARSRRCAGTGGGFERRLFEQRRNVVRCWTRMGVPMRAQVEVSLTVRKRRCSCSGPKYV